MRAALDSSARLSSVPTPPQPFSAVIPEGAGASDVTRILKCKGYR